MLSKLRARLTYANVIASIAMFLALTGGTAVALSGSNTVFTDDIVNGQVFEADLAPVQGWQNIADSVGPVCSATTTGKFCEGSGWEWANHGDEYAPVAYYRRDKVVRLRGLADFNFAVTIPPGDGQVIFYLPPGYRPGYRSVFTVDADDSTARVDIHKDGRVELVRGTGSQYLSLDGISFRAQF